MRHLPIPEQGRYLRLVLNGFYNDYAVPTATSPGDEALAPYTKTRGTHIHSIR